MRVLNGELAGIDGLLEDPRFFQPFYRFLEPCEGRPSMPMETYLRVLFLKYRFNLGRAVVRGAPPANVPSYMGTIATSSLTKSGSTITADRTQIVVVRTDGYGSLGQGGTGTVVAIVC